MAQKYIEDDFVMTRTEPNNFTPNGVVCKFVDYETIDKVLLRTINGIDGFIVEKGQFVQYKGKELVDEEGTILPQQEFWAIRSGGSWENGWEEYNDN